MKEVDYKEFYEKTLAARKKYHARRQMRIKLLMRKAIESGIVVTDKEVDDYMKKNAKK
jgi:hypothetical protein